MGIESLNTAAAAAGFAMVQSDDLMQEGAALEPNHKTSPATRESGSILRMLETSIGARMSELIGTLRTRAPA